MNGSGTFRFHRFKEEEKKTYRYTPDTKNFYNSNSFGNVQKFKTFQNIFPKNLTNNNLHTQSYQFTTKYSANIPRIPPNTFRNTPNYNTNKLLFSDINLVGIDSDTFKRIINSNFELILANGALTQIDKFLPVMLYNNLSFSNNNHLTLILKKFQINIKKNLMNIFLTQQYRIC